MICWFNSLMLLQMPFNMLQYMYSNNASNGTYDILHAIISSGAAVRSESGVVPISRILNSNSSNSGLELTYSEKYLHVPTMQSTIKITCSIYVYMFATLCFFTIAILMALLLMQVCLNYAFTSWHYAWWHARTKISFLKHLYDSIVYDYTECFTAYSGNSLAF